MLTVQAIFWSVLSVILAVMCCASVLALIVMAEVLKRDEQKKGREKA